MKGKPENQFKDVDDNLLKSIAPSCNIKGLAERKEAAKWLKENLYAHVHSVNELETGYELVFKKPDSELTTVLLDVVKQETECCPTFSLALIFEPHKKFVRYQYFGSESIKREMKEALTVMEVLK